MFDPVVPIQIQFSRDKIEEFERLMQQCKLFSKLDLFNAALTLFSWAVEELEAGRGIGSFDKKRAVFHEVMLPGLSAIKKKEKK